MSDNITKPVPVRIPPEMVARIDSVKPRLVPREAYIRDLLDKALEAEERTTAKRVLREKGA